MSNVFVRNGTPIGTVSLCDTCSNAHIVEGYRDSEAIVLCTYTSYDRPLILPFRVKSCTNHRDRNRPSYVDMQKLAIPISTGTLKPVGFLVQREVEGKGSDDLDD
jgi:hypothetical protein